MSWLAGKLMNALGVASSSGATHEKAGPGAAASLYPSHVTWDSTACSSCDSPCSSTHPEVPSYLRIDMEDEMAGTVKPYRRHVLLVYGRSGSWDTHIEKDEGSLAGQVAAVCMAVSKQLDYRILLSAADDEGGAAGLPTGPPGAAPADAAEGGAVALVFPEFEAVGPLTVGNASSVLQQYLTRGSVPEASGAALWSLRGAPETQPAAAAAEAPAAGSADASEQGTGEAARLPAYVLVCTHKRRDKRCGVVGPMVVEAIRKEAAQRGLEGKVTVCGVSHFGGHKFAGNAIVYPDGYWYGRVKPCHAPAILDRTVLQGVALKELWRGCIQAGGASSTHSPVPA